MRYVRARVIGLALVSALISVGVAMPRSAIAAFNHVPPWADVMSDHWQDGDALDTRGAGDAAVSALSSIGYNAFDNNGKTPSIAMGPSFAQDDAVWVMYGHANAGFITQVQGVLRADPRIDNPPSSCTNPHACISNYSSAQLHGIRFMMFAGCYTANSRTATDCRVWPCQRVSTLPWAGRTRYGSTVGLRSGQTIFFTQAAARTNILDSANIARRGRENEVRRVRRDGPECDVW